MRIFWLRLHRYIGLTAAIFLFIAGLTGSVLAFHDELDAWLNPELFYTGSRGERLSGGVLAERLELADTRLRVVSVHLPADAGAAVRVQVRPRTDIATSQTAGLDFDEVFVDPVNGRILGTRLWGGCCLQRKQLIPFLYVLHYSLHIPGDGGLWVMGIAGMIWIIETFVGFYLTLPATKKNSARFRADKADSALTGISVTDSIARHTVTRSWWQRWGLAWRIKRNAGSYRFNLDLHRAGGLWFFAVMMTLAVSGVSFNLRDAVFEPLVSVFSPFTPSPFDQREERAGHLPVEAQVSFTDMLRQARQEARKRGWEKEPASIFYNAVYGIYGVGFDNGQGSALGLSFLYFDGGNARPLGEYIPGTGTAADIFESWQLPLHNGRIAGLAGRIVICVTGGVVALLSVTGVLIWLRKRRAYRLKAGSEFRDIVA